MGQYEMSETAVIEAPAAVVYGIIADYNDGHQAILPRKYFTDMVVKEGGVGAGTVIGLTVNVMGNASQVKMVVSEPEPGRVLAETDEENGVVTRFIVEPLSENRSQITFDTVGQTASGLRGWIERMMAPRLLRTIYREEQALLAQVAQERYQATVAG